MNVRANPEPAAWARWLLRALVAGRLPPWLARRVHQHLVTTSNWREHYNALRATDRAAAGLPALSAPQRAWLVSSILDDVAPAPQAAHARGWFAVGAPMSMAAASLALFVIVSRGDGWAERGAQAVGARVRCVDANSQRVRAEAEGGEGARALAGLVTCQTGDVVVVTATNVSERDRSVVVVVADGTFISRIGAPMTVPRGTVDLALPSGVRLAGPGTRTVFALFLADPPPLELLQSEIDALQRAHTDVRPLARLPVHSDAQARVDVIVPGEAP